MHSLGVALALLLLSQPPATAAPKTSAPTAVELPRVELPPAELPRFEPEGEVVLTAADVPWAADLRERGALVTTPSGSVRLYFTGYDKAAAAGTPEALRRVGLAESWDGGRTWTVNPTPLTPPGLWVEDPHVVFADGQYVMAAESGLWSRLLVSADGLTWQDHGNLDIRQTDGSRLSPGPLGTPTLFREAGRWLLFYERRDAGIWVAESVDLTTFRNVSDDPVLRPTPGTFDAAMIALNQVARRDGRYVAYYHGTDRFRKPRPWAVGRAVSDDLRTWRKVDDNPLTPPKLNRSSGTVIRIDGRTVLFTTHEQVRRHEMVVEGR